MHCEQYLPCPRADTLVVFVHGFMGSPRQFDDLAQAVVASGRAALSVLLPGHGGDGQAFAAACRTHWEAHLRERLRQYAGGYAHIVLAGHSMGGLLALGVSMETEFPVCGVALLASPLRLRTLHPRSLIQWIRLLFYPAAHPMRIAYKENCGVQGGGALVWLRWLAPTRSLYQIMRHAGDNLARVRVPVWMVFSRGDETTVFKSAALFEKGLINCRHETLLLGKSSHAYYLPEERMQMKEGLLHWLDGLVQNDQEGGERLDAR